MKQITRRSFVRGCGLAWVLCPEDRGHRRPLVITYPAGKLDRRNALLLVPEGQFYR